MAQPPEKNLSGLGNVIVQGTGPGSIDIISQSSEYMELQKRLKELEEKFALIPESDTEERLAVSEQINSQKELIQAFEQNVVQLAQTFEKLEINTEKLTEAKDLFDQGLIKEARQVLESSEKERNKAKNTLLKSKKDYEERVLPGLQNLAAEYLTLAQSMASDFENPTRFEDTCRYYQASVEAYPNSENLLSYAIFLHKHNLTREAEGIYLRIWKEFPDVGGETLANVFNNLGILYLNKNEYVKAEMALRAALEINEGLAEKEPEMYESAVALSRNLLGIVFKNVNDFQSAEKEYLAAVGVYRNLVSKDHGAYLGDLALALRDLANLHVDRLQYERAEIEYNEALEIYRKLAEEDEDASQNSFAAVLESLAVLHSKMKKSEEAEAGFQEALEIQRKLVARNPRAYEDMLSGLLDNIGTFYAGIKRNDEAEKYYVESLELTRRLAENDPETYNLSLAGRLNNLGDLYTDEKSNPDLTEQYLLSALEIYREYAEEDKRAHQPTVSAVLGNLAKFYQDVKPDREKSVTMAFEAMELILPFLEQAPYTIEYATQTSTVLKKWGFTDDQIMNKVKTKVSETAAAQAAAGEQATAGQPAIAAEEAAAAVEPECAAEPTDSEPSPATPAAS